ncbi:hypothetical protein ACJ6YJ_32310, partial [Pseudomonas marginalis]|uniref:hypothetical protein n=1 Tax=Pseudomonas TaxID=286 RepID=UPI00389A389B
ETAIGLSHRESTNLPKRNGLFCNTHAHILNLALVIRAFVSGNLLATRHHQFELVQAQSMS